MIPSLIPDPEVSVTVTDGVGNGLTVIVELAVAVHPPVLVTVTV
jgi:hypothetical protein